MAHQKGTKRRQEVWKFTSAIDTDTYVLTRQDIDEISAKNRWIGACTFLALCMYTDTKEHALIFLVLFFSGSRTALEKQR